MATYGSKFVSDTVEYIYPTMRAESDGPHNLQEAIGPSPQ